MKIARILINSQIKYAKVERDNLFIIEGDCFDIKNISDQPVKEEYKLLSPCQPSKIIALGANYRKHAEELNLKINPVPLIFMKPPTSVIAYGEEIVLPPSATKVDYEAELAVIIGQECKNVRKEDAKSVVLGYTCANDVSERVFQKLDGQWTRAKGFDTFCPLGPYIETELDADNTELMAILNGKTVQKGNTSDMINDIDSTIAFISSIMTLKKGDVILTGTPEGIGQIKAGDCIEICVKGIGTLRNNVIQG